MLASPSRVDVNNTGLNPTDLRYAIAARATDLLFPRIREETFLKARSPSLGVSSEIPFSPLEIKPRTDADALFHKPYFCKTVWASAKVVESGTVGPDAIDSKESPTTSERTRFNILAG